MIDMSTILCKKHIISKECHLEINKLPHQVNISIDSRAIQKGDIFVALSGPSFNGCDFIEQSLDKGALGVVFSRSDHDNHSDLFARYQNSLFIKVKDTRQYLKDIAKTHLSLWKNKGGKVIGITGSNGKTTTKEMLSFLLKEMMGEKLLSTQGNLNNQVGVPLTIFKLLPSHKMAIIEMGTSEKGEIKILSDIAIPDAGIITNISAAHLEYLENEEGVFREKKALFDSVMENSNNEGIFIINRDNKYLRKLPQKKKTIFFGKERENNQHQLQFKKNGFQMNEHNIENEYLTGEHNFTNMACSLIMACTLFPSHQDEFIERAKKFKPSRNRSSWVMKDSTSIFLDAYNANPTSMKESIKAFSQVVNEKKLKGDEALYIIGDMNELGGRTESSHQQLGEFLAKEVNGKIIYIGRYYHHFQKGFPGSTHHFHKVEDFQNTLGAKYLSSFKMVFIKGSRSLQLEELVDIR